MGTPSNYALRLPASLKQGAEQVAREDGTTLNQFIVSAVAEKLSAMKTADYFTERGVSANALPARMASSDNNRTKTCLRPPRRKFN